MVSAKYHTPSGFFTFTEVVESLSSELFESKLFLGWQRHAGFTDTRGKAKLENRLTWSCVCFRQLQVFLLGVFVGRFAVQKVISFGGRSTGAQGAVEQGSVFAHANSGYDRKPHSRYDI